MRRSWSVMTEIITLFILLASVSGWGACKSVNAEVTTLRLVYSGFTCDGSECKSGACPTIYHSDEFYTDIEESEPTTCAGYSSTTIGACSGRSYKNIYCYAKTRCTTQTEADSVNCVNNGHQWDSISKICRTSACISSDTSWLTASIAACQDIRGSNNYALVDTNDVCEHRGHCCPLDSLIDGEGCKWQCESPAAACAANKGRFEYAIVADTAVSGSDTAYTGLCYNNCFMHASKDSLTGLVTGNVAAVDNTSIAVGTYYPDGFKGIRSDYGGIYTYDFLSDENYEWADSLLSAPCSVGMYRGIKNGKYIYWKSGQLVPEGVTNVVKVK